MGVISTSEPRLVADRKHLPALDGLRGVAILMVLFHHIVLWHHPQAVCRIDRIYALLTEMGWMGVDIFFVLSGFLITGILFSAKGADHYFRNFYARRTVRIFPIYYLFLIGNFVVVPLIYRQPAGVAYPWGYWLYVSNFIGTLPSATSKPSLIITWSLAIEEQFYLFWPAVIFLCNRAWAMRLASGLLLLSIGCRTAIALLRWDAMVDYYWTPCHLDGIAAGSLVALLVQSPNKRDWLVGKSNWIGAISIAGIAAVAAYCGHRGLSMRRDPLGQIPLYAIVSMLGVALLAKCLAGTGIIATLLNAKVLRLFGKYSYGLYLYHELAVDWVSKSGLYNLPTIAGSRMPSQTLFFFLTLACTMAMALLSWNLIERHCLKLKKFFPESPVRPLATAAADIRTSTIASTV